MMVPLKASRSTMAAHRRGSVKVLVKPEKDSLEAMAMLFFSSPSVGQDLEQGARRHGGRVPSGTAGRFGVRPPGRIRSWRDPSGLPR